MVIQLFAEKLRPVYLQITPHFLVYEHPPLWELQTIFKSLSSLRRNWAVF